MREFTWRWCRARTGAPPPGWQRRASLQPCWPRRESTHPALRYAAGSRLRHARDRVPQRVQHDHVPLSDFVQRPVRHRVGHARGHRQAHRLPDVLEHPIAGGGNDRVVKRRIRAGLRTMIVARGRFAHRRDQFLEPLQAGVVDARRRRARGHALECSANGINLEQLVGCDLADLRAPERRADDEPEHREVAERFTHRGLADAKLLREARFRRCGSRAAADR